MSLVNVVGMVVLDNPTAFLNPFQFEVTFECLSELEDDLEWKVTYVGSAEDSSKDQILDEVMVGPVPVGTNKFVLQADPPDPTTIGEADILGVTVVLVTCSYKEQEFCRVGYYVNNEYSEPFDEEQGVPTPLDITKVTRQILADKPRVTRFPIDWAKKEGAAPAVQAAAGMDSSDMMQSPAPSMSNTTPSTSSTTPADEGATREGFEVEPMSMEGL
ncbi:hypothetical protein TrCOL_g6221 [Triparma columacea]|uniref:Anti-silencing function protein 1 n=1 Tax=Triparma columacea TaxID=722753 RepID=A0A9W7LGD5_9STRA|nr:hypothetical protein TrCOL_g6221 [Triparma columacea]